MFSQILSWQRSIRRGRNKSARSHWRWSLYGYRPTLERLEDRTLLSTLDFDVATAPANLTWKRFLRSNSVHLHVSSGNYRFTDDVEAINLGTNAMALGWTGSGTNTVMGPTTSVKSLTVTGAGDFNSNLEVADPIVLNNGDASLQGFGFLNLNNQINANTVTVGLAGGGISQGLAGTLDSNALLLQGNGTFSLGQSGSFFNTLAANVSGPVTVNTGSDLTVGTVKGTSGLTTSNNDITLTTGGQLIIDAGLFPGFFNQLTLNCSAGVTQTPGVTGFLAASSLLLTGTGAFNFPGSSNGVANLAANVHGSLSYLSNSPLTVGSVGGTNGIATGGNPVNLAASGSNNSLTVSQAIMAGNANVTLNADNMTFSAAVSAGTQTAVLAPKTTSRPISLGTKPGNTLGLSQTDLNRVSAGVLRVGNMDQSNTGNIQVTAAVTAPSATLSLSTGGAITDTGSFKVTATNLALRSANGIGSSTTPLATAVTNLAFNNTAANGVQVNNTGSVTLTGVDGLSTSTTRNGAFTLNTTGALTVNAGINLGTGALRLTESGTATFSNNSTLTAATGMLTGSSGTNTVVVNYSVNTTFMVNAMNAGTITNTSIAISSGLGFGGFGSLTGGVGSDTFKVMPGGSLSGNVDGGSAGTDTLDYSALGTTVAQVTITGKGTTHGNTGRGSLIMGLFDDMNAVIGNSGGGKLTGPGAANTWTINNQNAGVLTSNLAGSTTTLAFSSFASATGGGMAAGDTFQFMGGGKVTGTIDGAKDGALDFTNSSGVSVAITGATSGLGFSGTAPAVIGSGYTDINSFTGGTGSTLALAGNVTNNGFNLNLGGSLAATITGTLGGTGQVVQTGGSLNGTGTINEVVNLNAGTLHPGTSGPGTLTATKSVTFNTGTMFQADLGGAATSLLDASAGTVDLGGRAVLNAGLVSNFQPALNQQFLILKAAALNGTFQGLPDGTPLIINGQAFKINYPTIGAGPTGGPPANLLSSLLTRTVYPTQAQFSASPAFPAFGQSVTLMVAVSWVTAPYDAHGMTPGGMVSFMEDGQVVGQSPLVGGRASMSTSGLTPGPHAFSVAYSDTSSVPNSLPVSGNAMVTVGQPGHSPDLAFGSANGYVSVFQYTAQPPGVQLVADFAPFGAAYGGPVTVALGDIRHTGIKDLVVAAAVGNPNVKVYDGSAFVKGTFDPNNPDASALTSFFPYALQFNVGANVAVGDIEHDGYPDIVTGATVGNPDVRVYRGKDLATGHFDPGGTSMIAQWFPYALQFDVGANVAVGDIEHDGFADVVTGATAGNPDVRVYRGRDIAAGHFDTTGASLVAQFFPYALQFDVGAFVAVGDTTGSGFGDVITGASVGNPDVRIYSGQAIAQGAFNNANPDANQLDQFYAYTPLNQGIGATVAAADLEQRGKADVIVGSTASPQFRVFPGNAQGLEPPTVLSDDLSAFPGFDSGGLFVGA